MREILNAALDHIEKLSRKVHEQQQEIEELESKLRCYAEAFCKDDGFSSMVHKHMEDDSKSKED
jgi:uncharacterized coiled-coil protein SlyX